MKKDFMWEELLKNLIGDVSFVTIGSDSILAWSEKHEVLHTWPKTDQIIDILKDISKTSGFTVYNYQDS